MSRNSPSARYHRAIVFLAHLEQYRRLGPLIGPKEKHQPDPRWRCWPTDGNDGMGCMAKTDGGHVCARWHYHPNEPHRCVHGWTWPALT